MSADRPSVSVVSHQTRAIALAAALVAVALGLGMLALSHLHTSANAPVKVIKPLHPVTKHVTPAKPVVHAKVMKAVAPVHPKVKHAAVPVVPAKVKAATPVVPAVKPKPAAKPKMITGADGLPVAISQALR